MNKQELIERIECLKNIFGNKNEYVKIDMVVELLSELDEPEKVKVPQFVADWIEYCKIKKISLAHALYRSDEAENKSVYRWIVECLENQETFARAWIEGYEVEKEKRYLVKVKGVYLNSCLVFDKGNKKWFFSSIYEIEHQTGYHTRKELEDAGFGEVFNSSLFEVEEVEE